MFRRGSRVAPAAQPESSHGHDDTSSSPQATYHTTKTHGLHRLAPWRLCHACSKIDLKSIAESKLHVLLPNCWDLEASSTQCRFCAFLYQTVHQDLEAALVRQGLPTTRYPGFPLCLRVKPGLLFVRIVARHGDTERLIRLAEFEVFQDEEETIESAGPSPFPPPLANRLSYEAEGQLDRTDHPVQDRAAVAAASVEPKLETLQCFCSLDGLVIPPDHSVGDIMRGLASPRARVGPRAKPPRLPSRVIDLSLLDPDRPAEFCRLSLHYTRDADSGIFADYAALSHRWGGKVPFQTTKETLNERTAGFALGELPRSFQDAALVARRLGIRYLWIDSLCIVQDDEGDWLLESRRMGVIFADASVTIAAHSSPNPGHGFLSSALVPDFLRIRPENPSGRFAIRIPDPANANLLQRFKHSCIMSRAWVVQELSLSPRILHFVEDHVIWECIHCPVGIGGEMPGTLAGELLRGRRGANHYDYWYRLVQQYSRCSMTEPEDKLVALAGIVDQFHNLFPSMLYHDYHCGVFNTDIVRGILWFARPHHAALQRHPGRAPSWSWASVDGPLGFACDITPSIADVSSRITIRSFMPGTAEPIPFEGEHGPGCPLVFESLLIKRKFAVRPRKPKVLAPGCYNPGVVGVWTPHGRSDYPADIAWEILDSGAGIEVISSSVRCVVVSRMTSEDTYLGSWMLLLTKSKSTPGAYERVGFGCLLDESVLKKARREVITLV